MRDRRFSRFDTIPECDRLTDTHTHRHTMTAYTALSIALRGKNGSHEQNHAPFSGDLSSLWPVLILPLFVQSSRALASAIPWVMVMRHPKLTSGSAMAEGPRDSLSVEIL